VLRAYVIVDVPAATPVTMPEVDTTVATDVALLLHEPPAVLSASVIVKPVQTFVRPVITEGNGLEVTVVVTLQPEAVMVYVMVVVPDETP